MGLQLGALPQRPCRPAQLLVSARDGHALAPAQALGQGLQLGNLVIEAEQAASVQGEHAAPPPAQASSAAHVSQYRHALCQPVTAMRSHRPRPSTRGCSWAALS